MAEFTNNRTEQTAIEAVPLPDKPFNELTDQERASLTVAQLKAYEAKVKEDQKRRKREYRNLLNKLKKETVAAEKTPWEDRGRRNQFLYRLGVGLSYYLSKLEKQDQNAASELFKLVLDHVANSDYQFTLDYFTSWRAAGCPLTALETENKGRDKRAEEHADKTAANTGGNPAEIETVNCVETTTLAMSASAS